MSEPDNETRAKILAEIIEMTRGEPIANDEFTVKHFSEVSGLTEDRAAKKLAKLVKSKKLTKRVALIDGSWRNVYKMLK